MSLAAEKNPISPSITYRIEPSGSKPPPLRHAQPPNDVHLRPHGREDKRRYSWRSDTSLSSRSDASLEASAALWERLSSSGSDSTGKDKCDESQEDLVHPGDNKDEIPKSGSKFRYHANKQRAKSLVKRLIAEPENAHRIAAALLKLAIEEAEGRRIVVNRFLKTPEQLRDSLKAILLNGDAEIGDSEALSDASVTGGLLKLLANHANILYDALPAFLKTNSMGAAGVRYLLLNTGLQASLRFDDWKKLSTFAGRVIRDELGGTVAWEQGVKLLEALLRCRDSDEYLRLMEQSGKIRATFDLVVDYLVYGDRRTPIDQGTTFRQQLGPRAATLRLLRTSTKLSFAPVRWMFEKGLGATLSNIVTSRATTTNATEDWTSDDYLQTGPSVVEHPFLRCLALATLSALIDVNTIREEIVEYNPSNGIIQTCVDVVLAATKWQLGYEEEMSKMGMKRMYPHEYAYDILRHLPGSAITSAFDQVFDQAASTTTAEHYKLLQSLLWVSNTCGPHGTIRAALMGRGFFQLAWTILAQDVPGLEDPNRRRICRVKGDALTCIGNLVEQSKSEDLQGNPLLEGIINAIQRLEEDVGMPQRQRQQATFALSRYRKVVASRTQVENK